MSDQDKVQPGNADDTQPWREERHQPEPLAIEGLHAGRRVPEEKQRHPADDTQVGAASRVEDDDADGGRGRDTEGAFGEQDAGANANNLSDYRDAGIAKNELGPSGHDNRAPHADRTEGGHS